MDNQTSGNRFEIKQKYPGSRWYYASGEDFVVEIALRYF